jgi:type I restriction enzyme R subunit
MDTHIGEIERKTQNRIVQLFQKKLNYTYLGNYQYREGNSNVEKELLTKFLIEKQHYSLADTKKAIGVLERAAICNPDTMYDVNHAVYGLLRYGVNISPEVGANKKTIQLIDWENPLLNDFYIAEEVAIKGVNEMSFDKRPDILIYVNGIAIADIELKRSTVSVHNGIRQNIDSQKEEFIRTFFSTMQLLCAGNDTEGLWYGVIDTPEKFWLKWKEYNPDVTNELDRSTLQLFEKKRLLELIHDFIIYDAGVKKACRPNQYFAVKAAQPRVRVKDSGIIWEAQGSGKSLIMVWLAQWIHENVEDARVVIITDRDELDEQIEENFKNTGEIIKRASSGQDLIDTLNEPNPWLICSLIHKFGNKGVSDSGESFGKKTQIPMKKYLEDIVARLPEGFKAKGNLFVFVDECHRTQGGYLHEAMIKIMGDNVMLIGFTGTPLLKGDKKTSLQTFGTPIHTYKFNEAVEDHVILDLQYEPRTVPQHLGNKDKIDKWFDNKTKGLNSLAASELKKRWENLQNLFSSKERIDRIVADICTDFDEIPILSSGHGNAMLVADSIYQACRYWKSFQDTTLKGHCAVVTSYSASSNDLKYTDTGEGLTEDAMKYDIYKKMLNGKEPDKFESWAKDTFVKKPAQMKLLIVVDKLLTGFDAPSATYMYIDKQMRDHNLFQAICWVNRVNDDEKMYGHIVDYQDLFNSLKTAINDYTSDAFDKYDKEDIEGYIKEKHETQKKDLDDALQAVETLCEPINPPTREEYFKYFVYDESVSFDEQEHQMVENAERRMKLYKLVNNLLCCYANCANDMEKMGYTDQETTHIADKADWYYSLKHEIELKSGDYIDLKQYEPDMRNLLDLYVRADDSEKLFDFDDMSFLDLVAMHGSTAFNKLPDNIKKDKKSTAETLIANVRKIIRNDRPFNPAFFDKLSIILQTIIDEMNSDKKDYVKTIEKLINLVKQYKEGVNNYPASIDSPGKRSLYDNLGEDEVLSLKVHQAVKENAQLGFKEGNTMKIKKLKLAIAKAICVNSWKDEKVNEIFEIVKLQGEY